MFEIDGVQWDIPCSIDRQTELRSSDVSGFLLDKSYFNDVIGTYIKYSISIAVPFDKRNQYAELYETVANPVGAHTFVFPYNNSTITFQGRVASMSDTYVRLADGSAYWKGFKFTAISNTPIKAYSYSDIVAWGQPPYPDVVSPEEGTTYQWTNGAWHLVEE